jgi:putative flippase GtrA
VLRFGMIGSLAGLTQLALLLSFQRVGWHALVANATAFVLAAQLNFILSHVFTWRDRPSHRSLARRWLAFHGSIASMALVNMAVFAVASTAVPTLAAAASGILAAAIGNYLIGDRLVFVPSRPRGAYDDHSYARPAA